MKADQPVPRKDDQKPETLRATVHVRLQVSLMKRIRKAKLDVSSLVRKALVSAVEAIEQEPGR